MKIHCADRTCEDRILHGITEKVKARIRGKVLAQGIHVDPDLLPLFKITDRSITVSLRTRPRHRAAAGSSVTDRTCLARTHVSLRIFQYFLIGHAISSLNSQPL